jgi:hypothetical protein
MRAVAVTRAVAVEVVMWQAFRYETAGLRM